MVGVVVCLVAALTVQGRLPAVQASGHALEDGFLRQLVERTGGRTVPKNIALSRRAYDFGVHFWRAGDFARALAAMDAALRFDPSYALAYATRATVRSQRGDQTGAIEDATRAIALDPKLPEAFYNRGVAYGRMRDWVQAAADYAQALHLAPKLGNGAAHNNLGSALMAQGRLDDATENFSRAIELDPKNALLFFNRALAHDRAGHIDKAIADINSTLELSDAFMKAHHYRAVLLMKKGLEREALVELDAAIRQYPDDAVAVADRGLLQERLGDKEAAQLDFKRFSELSIADPRTLDRERYFLPMEGN